MNEVTVIKKSIVLVVMHFFECCRLKFVIRCT